MGRPGGPGPLDPIFDVPTSYGSIAVGNTPGTTPLTVTINQGSGQEDPTADTSLVFDVVFSEAVASFTGANVTLSGTAGATTAIVSGTGPTYTVTVTGMTVDGTVIASIPAGVTTSVALGLPNYASTSTDNTITWFTSPLSGGLGPFSAGDGFNYLVFESTDTLGVSIPTTVEALVAAGGGSGGSSSGLFNSTRAGGGGAGEVHYESALALSANQAVTVGAGGTAAAWETNGANGGTTSIGALVTTAGGGGGGGANNAAGLNGGSGGGGAGSSSGGSGAGGTATAVPPGVGHNGAAGNTTGTHSARYGGGGGGSSTVGSTTLGGAGTSFPDWSIIGYPDGYLGGGGGGAAQSTSTTGGIGGGGQGSDNVGGKSALPGVPLSGGGSGGRETDSSATSPIGGSGVVAVRWPSTLLTQPKFTTTSRGASLSPSLPSGAASGDLVIGFVGTSGGTPSITFSSGWTGPSQLQTGNTTTRPFARILDGSGSDTLTITATGATFSNTGMYLIKAANHGLLNVSQISYASGSGTANVVPPTLTPSSGSNFLWIVGAYVFADNSNGAEVTRAPAAFAKSHNLITSEISPKIKGMLASKRDTNLSVTPGAFTNGTPSGNSHAWTIGVPFS